MHTCVVCTHMYMHENDIVFSMRILSGYRYFGLQYGTQCFCGNSFGRYGRSPNQGECNKPCPANRNEICGGTWRNSVYDTQPPREYKKSSRFWILWPATWHTVFLRQQFWQIYVKRPNQGECNKLCPANRNELCCGTWGNSVYDTWPPPKSST